MSEIASAMRSRRTMRGGKAIYQSEPTIYAMQNLIKALIKKKQSKVGFLASGWYGASKMLGKIRVPQWISRHSAPGTTKIRATMDEVKSEITNAVDYSTDVYGMGRRVRAALGAQERGMVRRLDFFVNKAKTKAGF